MAVPLTIINPTTQVSFSTAIGLQFVLNKQINLGDIIQIQLDSYNLINSMYGFTSVAVECEEGVKGILTASVSLVCDVQQYPSNNLPLIIRVYPTQVVVTNTQV